MHTCCNLGPAPSKSILFVNEREYGDVIEKNHREPDGNFDKDHRTNPSNLSFIRETIPLVARLPGWPNYTEKRLLSNESTKLVYTRRFDDVSSRSGFSHFFFVVRPRKKTDENWSLLWEKS